MSAAIMAGVTGKGPETSSVMRSAEPSERLLSHAVRDVPFSFQALVMAILGVQAGLSGPGETEAATKGGLGGFQGAVAGLADATSGTRQVAGPEVTESLCTCYPVYELAVASGIGSGASGPNSGGSPVEGVESEVRAGADVSGSEASAVLPGDAQPFVAGGAAFSGVLAATAGSGPGKGAATVPAAVRHERNAAGPAGGTGRAMEEAPESPGTVFTLREVSAPATREIAAGTGPGEASRFYQQTGRDVFGVPGYHGTNGGPGEGAVPPASGMTEETLAAGIPGAKPAVSQKGTPSGSDATARFWGEREKTRGTQQARLVEAGVNGTAPEPPAEKPPALAEKIPVQGSPRSQSPAASPSGDDVRPRTVEMQIVEPEIGKLTVLLTSRGNDLSVRFLSPDNRIREALWETRHELYDAMSEKGLNLAGFSVESGWNSTGERAAEQRGTERTRIATVPEAVVRTELPLDFVARARASGVVDYVV